MNRTLSLAAAAAAALATAATAAPTATAARRDGAVLGKTSVRVGGSVAPAVVSLRVRDDAVVRLWVNGRRADGMLEEAGRGRRVAPLTARNGVKPGLNRLRIRATLPGGAYDSGRRDFRIDRRDPIADAGADRAHTVGSPLRLGSAGGGLRAAPAARPTRHRWRIVSAPRGSRAVLRDADSARPTLRPRRAGTYVLRLTADGAARDAVSHDMVTVTARPDDAPLGVPIRTLRPDTVDRVWIDGGPAGYTYDTNGIFVVVLERATRAIVESGTTPRHGGGIAQLTEMARKYADKGANRYLMIIASRRGVERGDVDALLRMTSTIGGGTPSAGDRGALDSGGPFSVIGVPGAPADTAWSFYDRQHRTADGAPTAGELSGLLQWNRLAGAYDFVDPRRPTYDTAVRGTDARTSVVRFDGRTYSASLDSGVSGFHVLAVDDTLRVTDHGAFKTTTGGDQATLAAKLKTIAEDQSQPLLIFQSIGTPKGWTGQWNDVVAQMEKFGANRSVANALDGRAGSTYALVGRIEATQPAAESSGRSGGGGELAGGIARTRAWRFEPAVTDDFGRLDTSVIELAYQDARPWPALDAAGEKAAMKYAVQKLAFCGRADPACDGHPNLRYYYWSSYAADWGVKLTTLSNLREVPESAAFTQADLDKVRRTLVPEVTAVASVKNWVGNLQKPLARSEGGSLKDLEDATRRTLADFDPPPGSSAITNVFGLLDDIATKATEKAEKIESPAANYLGAMAGVMSLVAWVTRPGDPFTLGGPVRARADQLADELIARLASTESALTGVGLLFVSDYGKLMGAAAEVDSDWKPGADYQVAVADLKLAARKWVMGALVPVAYPYLIRATPGVNDGRDIRCQERQADRTVEIWTPFPGQSVQSQQRVIESFNGNGAPIETMLFFTRGYADTSPFHYRPFPAPTARLADELFHAPTDASPGIGIDKLSFYDPRRFDGRLHRANQMAWNCDIGYLKRSG